MNLDFAFLNWGVVSNFILKGLAFSVQLTIIALVVLLAVAVGVVESVMARLKLLQVPQLLVGAVGLAILALMLMLGA